MFHHIVNIKCKRGDRTALHRRMKSFGRAVVKSQPGAVSCTYHANVGETTTARHVGPGSTQGYTHVFVCAFKSRRDFDHYMTSEIHLALGPDFARHVKEHLVCDYQTR